MNRRDLLKTASALVGVAGTGSAVDLIPEATPGDLLVLTAPGPISCDIAERLKRVVEGIWPDETGPKVLVLSDGMTCQVHRGVGRVELPKD